MAKGIKIRVSSVRNINARVPQIKYRVNSVKYSVQNAKNCLEYQVRARNGIDASLNSIIYDLANLENTVGDVYRTVNKCVDTYVSADERVKNLSHNVSDWK